MNVYKYLHACQKLQISEVNEIPRRMNILFWGATLQLMQATVVFEEVQKEPQTQHAAGVTDGPKQREISWIFDLLFRSI